MSRRGQRHADLLSGIVAAGLIATLLPASVSARPGTQGSIAADTTPPTVSLTAPSPGSTVSHVVSLEATASDDVGVTTVEFFRDGGTSLGVDTTAPYQREWDSTTASNGSHVLTAVARDAAGNQKTSTAVPVTSTNPGFVNEVVVPGITAADTLAFLPGGRMLVGELTETIWVVQPGASQPDPTPFLQLDGSRLIHEQGLLDILVDPNFAQNGWYYIFYTRAIGSGNHNRVSRFTASGNTTVPGSEVALWEDPDIAGEGLLGGSLALGNDGKLYISTGENWTPSDAQRLDIPRGKILRINRDGTIPADNPFHDGAGPNRDEIWAYGLRNPFRISIDPVTGTMYIGDVGSGDHSTSKEELNIGVRGANYGWPICEGPCAASGMTNPTYWYPHGGRDACVIGGVVYRGTQFPSEYYGSYFFGDYVQHWIRRAKLDASGNVSQVLSFWPSDGSLDNLAMGDPVELVEGPDGSLYYVDIGFYGTTQNPAAIRRIRYVLGNQQPVVAASAAPTSGQAPLPVTFSSAGSSDPEGQPLSYSWTFGDGATSTQANPTHTYTAPGQYTARLTVSDGTSSAVSSDLTIRVGTPPAPTILTPATGSLFRAGDVITYSGSATDAEDGPLPPSAFSWTILFHHDSHVHPGGGPFTNTTSGTLPIPTSGHAFDGNTNFEIVLTVTDSTGLSASTSVTIVPDKVNVTYNSVPSGLTLTIDGISRPTPFVVDDLKGFQRTITAPNQSSGGTAYNFASWSDGGPQSHVIVVPTVDQSLVATFQSTSGPAGLVAAWSFNEGSGTSVADASASANTGSTGAATWSTAGKFGNALSFNGSSARVTVPDSSSLRLSSAMTLEAWVFPTTVNSAWRDVIYKGSDNYYLEATSSNSGRPVVGGIFNGSYGESYGTANLVANAWTHLAATYDGATLRLFVNGTQVASTARTGTIATSAGVLSIGGDPLYGQYFTGRIDEVRVYSSALTQAQIQTDMATPIGGAAPPDTTPPTAPSGLGATAAGPTQINLSWTAATDNVAVTQYRVERCQGAGCTVFAEIATTGTATSYSDSGRSPATSYTYRVRAQDAALNNGPYSATATAVTPAAPDTTPPTAPTGLGATATSPTQVNLAWTAATDNVAVTQYRVERCQGAGCTVFAEIATTGTTTSYSDSGRSPATSYTYRVRAQDAALNNGPYSATATAVTPAAPDTTPPTAPTGLGATAAGPTQVNLAWTAATDNVAVTQYRVERCQGAGCTVFAEIATTGTATSYSDSGRSPATSYTYRVRAQDAALNNGPYSATATTTTPAAPDTTPPTAPTGLTATAVNPTQVNLAWTAATDNVAVTQYRVERCQGAGCTVFAEIATTGTTTSYSDNGRSPATSYTYRVRAQDAALNNGPYSTTATTTTPAAPDTTPPTAPTGLGATATSPTQINLAWTAATDNVAVTQYRVERCQGAGCTVFAEIATTGTTTSYSDSGRSPATSYTYRVRAQDAALNNGPYSTTATAITLAGTTGLVAAYSFDEGAGATVADSSGTDNNGTVANTSWTTSGKYGNALSFNGTNARVTIPDAPSLRLTNAMTLEAWVNPTVVNRAWRDVIYKGDDNYYLMGTSSRNPAVPVGGGRFGGAGVEVNGTAALTVSTWTHLAVTYDGTTLRLYVNGAQVATRARTGTMATSANPLQIGGDSLYGQYFNGLIDEVRIYNRALAPTELQTDMATPIAPAPLGFIGGM